MFRFLGHQHVADDSEGQAAEPQSKAWQPCSQKPTECGRSGGQQHHPARMFFPAKVAEGALQDKSLPASQEEHLVKPVCTGTKVPEVVQVQLASTCSPLASPMQPTEGRPLWANEEEAIRPCFLDEEVGIGPGWLFVHVEINVEACKVEVLRERNRDHGH